LEDTIRRSGRRVADRNGRVARATHALGMGRLFLRWIGLVETRGKVFGETPKTATGPVAIPETAAWDIFRSQTISMATLEKDDC
jgi:hypothetical protein